MRRIAYLKWDRNPNGWDKCLDLCSNYTPLVEPLSNEAIYLDLGGCGDTLAILRDIGRITHDVSHGCLQAGVATSRLISRIATEHQYLPRCPRASYQIHSYPGIQTIEVLPGKEKEFISPLPLDSVDSLPPKLIKKLFRMGFSTVSDLCALSPSKLLQFTGENPYLLTQQLNGLDLLPVTGLYPPSRLTYPIELEEDAKDLVRIKKMIGDAVIVMEGLLEERYSGCNQVKIEIRSNQKTILKERQLSSPCYRAGQLLNIISGLLCKEVLNEGLSSLLITLQDFTVLTFSQPDLFANRVFLDNREKEDRLETLIQNLKDRFPDSLSLQRGITTSRREQILALIDPWRKFKERVQ